MSEYSKEYYAKNREKMLKNAKEWQKKNMDKVNEYHRKYNKKKIEAYKEKKAKELSENEQIYGQVSGMKKWKIVYKIDCKGTMGCVVYANNWYHLKVIVDGLFYNNYGDIISIQNIE